MSTSSGSPEAGEGDGASAVRAGAVPGFNEGGVTGGAGWKPYPSPEPSGASLLALLALEQRMGRGRGGGQAVGRVGQGLAHLPLGGLHLLLGGLALGGQGGEPTARRVECRPVLGRVLEVRVLR